MSIVTSPDAWKSEVAKSSVSELVGPVGTASGCAAKLTAFGVVPPRAELISRVADAIETSSPVMPSSETDPVAFSAKNFVVPDANVVVAVPSASANETPLIERPIALAFEAGPLTPKNADAFDAPIVRNVALP